MRTLKVLFLIVLVGSLVYVVMAPRNTINYPNAAVWEVVVENPTDLDKKAGGAVAFSMVMILLLSALQAYKNGKMARNNAWLKEEIATIGFLLGETRQTSNDLRRAIEELKEGSPAHSLASQKLALQEQIEQVKKLEEAMSKHEEQAQLIAELATQQAALKQRINKLQEAKSSIDEALVAADVTDDEIREGLSNLEDEGDENAQAKFNRINTYLTEQTTRTEVAEKLVVPVKELKAKFEALKIRVDALDDDDTGIYAAFEALDGLKETIEGILDSLEEDSEGNSLEDNISTYREVLEKLAERINDVNGARESLLELLADVIKLIKPEEETTPPEDEVPKA